MQEKERIFLARADRVQYGVFICKTVGFADAAPVFVCDFGVGQMVALRGAFQQFGAEFDLTFLREGAHVLRISALALPVRTLASQEGLGVGLSPLMMLIISPFLSSRVSGAGSPLISQPMVQLPRSVWI